MNKEKEFFEDLFTNKSDLAGGNEFSGVQNFLTMIQVAGVDLKSYGTFLPTLTAPTSPTQSYATQAGYYLLLGNEFVFILGRVAMASSGITAGSGILSLNDLPYINSDDAGGFSAINIGFAGGFSSNAPTQGFINVDDNSANLYRTASGAGSSVAADASTIGNDSRINFSGFYRRKIV